MHALFSVPLTTYFILYAVVLYVKMKSLNAQPASTMVVGVSPVGS